MKKKSNLEKWAEKEVELACKKEAPDRKDGEFDYGCACYESALKAFRSLCEDGYSGFSIGMTKHILNRLIEGRPLTPIEDTDDIWNLVIDHGGYKAYQCRRMDSLFKDIYPDGSVKYVDNNYCYCIADNDHSNTYTLKLARDIVHEMFPITMPYSPGEPIKIYCTEFLYDPANGDFDTVGILYVIKPNDERVFINRYFKDGPREGRYPGWTEISEAEYIERVKAYNEADIE